jgi:toxin FitB
VNGWLFDTDVLSALAPGRAALSETPVSWFEARNEELFFSVITVMEINAGVTKLRRVGAARRSEAMQAWFGDVLGRYGDRVLSFDVASARLAGELSDTATAIGRHPGFADIAIAAIAKSHDLIVLTANRRHFEPLGVATFNPLSL